jgi:hypothetical protein
MTKNRPAVAAAAAPAKPTKTPTLKTPVDVLVLLVGPADAGTYQVHLKGCKQYAAAKNKSQYKGQEDWVLEGILNRSAVILEAWDDQITETRREDKDLTDDQKAEDVPWAWLLKNGYVGATDFHTCLTGLPQSSKAAAAKSESIKKSTRQELATRVVEQAATLLDEIFARDTTADEATDDTDELPYRDPFADQLVVAFGSEVAARQCTAQWMHGMPVDRDRWFLSGLPIPDRSDWKDYTPPATDTESQNA